MEEETESVATSDAVSLANNSLLNFVGAAVDDGNEAMAFAIQDIYHSHLEYLIHLLRFVFNSSLRVSMTYIYCSPILANYSYPILNIFCQYV